MEKFATLSEEEDKEIWRLYRFYGREATRCEEAKAYLAGCIMMGSALEALLMLMVNVYDGEALATGKAPTKGKKTKSLLDWDLGELLRVAKAAGWLPAELDPREDWNSRKAKVGDHAEVVRMVRNLAHPGRYCQEHFRGRITRKYLEHQFEAVDACREWLADHNAKSIHSRMKEEEEADEHREKERHGEHRAKNEEKAAEVEKRH